MKTGFCEGVTGTLVSVPEAIVALSDRSLRELRIRVRTALEHSGLSIGERRAREIGKHRLGDWMGAQAAAVPTHIAAALGRTYSMQFDLPVALAYAGAEWDGIAVGELSLSGDLRPVRGLVPILIAARDAGITEAIVPTIQAWEAQMVDGLEFHFVSTLTAALHRAYVRVAPETPNQGVWCPPTAADLPPDLLPAYEQTLEHTRRGQHVLLVGPVASGKTMIARRLVSAFEAPSPEQRLELAAIASAAGFHPAPDPRRPFRAPHHTASAAAIMGGGSPARPGEVTLAHHGILFLDELPEFRRTVLEELARILAQGEVRITRRHRAVCMPAKATVVAAMNPCSCGYFGHRRFVCRCSKAQIARFGGRVEHFVEALNMAVVPMSPAIEALLNEAHRT